MAADPTEPRARPVDVRGLQHQVRRLMRAPAAPWLHGEVARRMAERLALIRHRPRHVLDWGAQLGDSAEVLAAACPQAEIVAVEATVPAPPAEARRRWWWPARRTSRHTARAAEEIADAVADLLWSNMGLHFAIDIEAQLQRWRRCIAADGFLMFSTLGPGTGSVLRDLYRQQGWPAPMAPFVDMHDLGDMLVQAGFAEPVMDQEEITLTWADASAMLAELRSLGGNADPQRWPGVRTPRWRSELESLLDAQRDDQGRVRMGFEVVYGHAFCPSRSPRIEPQSVVSLAQMRQMLRSSRRSA